MIKREFTEKHWKAVAETARGYELVIEAIDEKRSIDTIRSMIKGFNGCYSCLLCVATSGTRTCEECIYGPNETRCISIQPNKSHFQYGDIYHFKSYRTIDTKSLREFFAIRLEILNELVDKAGYILVDVD